MSHVRTSTAFMSAVAALILLRSTAPCHAASPVADASFTAPADKLVYRQSLYDNGSRVGEICFYSNIGGLGGYFQITNLTKQNRKFRVSITNNEGKAFGRIAHATAGGYSSKQSCSSAGQKKAGIKNVTLRYAKVE